MIFVLLVFHFVKSVRIRNFSGPYFPIFGLNTEIYGVSLRNQSECGKIRTRKTLNTDTFHAVSVYIYLVFFNFLVSDFCIQDAVESRTITVRLLEIVSNH